MPLDPWWEGHRRHVNWISAWTPNFSPLPGGDRRVWISFQQPSRGLTRAMRTEWDCEAAKKKKKELLLSKRVCKHQMDGPM